MDIKGSGIDMKGGKVDIRNADIKRPNINIDGKLPDMNIKGKGTNIKGNVDSKSKNNYYNFTAVTKIYLQYLLIYILS